MTEDERLDAVRRYDILDRPPDGAFDRITALAARLFDVPIAIDPWLVSDARVDPRTMANPLVAGELGLRFYAGVPLADEEGRGLGTLCIIDRAPRTLTPDEVATLQDLAAVVVDELELRLASRRLSEQERPWLTSSDAWQRTSSKSRPPSATFPIQRMPMPSGPRSVGSRWTSLRPIGPRSMSSRAMM